MARDLGVELIEAEIKVWFGDTNEAEISVVKPIWRYMIENLRTVREQKAKKGGSCYITVRILWL
jgi:hypothetical protein